MNENGNKRVVSPRVENDEECEYQLCRMEMKRICAARAAAAAEKKEEAENARERRMNACDLTGDEFRIVCEEVGQPSRKHEELHRQDQHRNQKKSRHDFVDVRIPHWVPLVYGRWQRSLCKVWCWRNHVEFRLRIVSLSWRGVGWRVSWYYRILRWHSAFDCLRVYL